VGEVAALFDDGDLQSPPQRVAGQDAEIAADVGENGADQLAADFCGDLLRGGQVCDTGVGFVGGGRGGWPGCAWPPWGRSTSGCSVQAVGVAEEPRFERAALRHHVASFAFALPNIKGPRWMTALDPKSVGRAPIGLSRKADIQEGGVPTGSRVRRPTQVVRTKLSCR